MSRPRIRVGFECTGRWIVIVTGISDWAGVIVGVFKTRTAANAYAKPLRKALGGSGGRGSGHQDGRRRGFLDSAIT